MRQCMDADNLHRRLRKIIGVRPPHFVVFCNDKKLFHFSYRRYLENQIRSVFGLEGTPIIMTVRQKGEEDS